VCRERESMNSVHRCHKELVQNVISYSNSSQKAVVVLHEIYGVNRHIAEVSRRFSDSGFDVFAPDMLNTDRVFGNSEEEAAYSNFISNIGFTGASDMIIGFLHEIRSRYDSIYIVGYSAGATVAWICSREHDLCDGVVGFYGSRIRDYLEIVPACPVLLFFPEKEGSFEVDNVINVLSNKDNVCTEKFCGRHGFADPFSRNYNEESYAEAYKRLIEFISSGKAENITAPVL
jgi:dienelactone hydrolase